jgi:transcriptional/translational regulatory protein YebC/TACO1
MPKDKVEAAIKRAMGKDMENYEEIMYEGYGPHGIAIIVEAATDNIVRTVANVRSIFNKGNGAMSTSGSVSFQFNKMGAFNLNPEGIDAESLELELIDFGLQEMGEGTDDNGNEIIVVRCGFSDFGNMQKALEEKSILFSIHTWNGSLPPLSSCPNPRQKKSLSLLQNWNRMRMCRGCSIIFA